MSFDLNNAIRSIATGTVSIPFDQGNVFRLKQLRAYQEYIDCLNPFRSGQCLSTKEAHLAREDNYCLNPFRSGQCLSTY